jgi:hypothetical protein
MTLLKEIENRGRSAELEFLRQRNEEAKQYKRGKGKKKNGS